MASRQENIGWGRYIYSLSEPAEADSGTVNRVVDVPDLILGAALYLYLPRPIVVS